MRQDVLAVRYITLTFRGTLPASSMLLRKLLSRVMWELLRVLLHEAAGMVETDPSLLSSDRGSRCPLPLHTQVPDEGKLFSFVYRQENKSAGFSRVSWGGPFRKSAVSHVFSFFYSSLQKRMLT